MLTFQVEFGSMSVLVDTNKQSLETQFRNDTVLASTGAGFDSLRAAGSTPSSVVDGTGPILSEDYMRP